MNSETSQLFQRVARKMGWTEDGLVASEKKLMTSVGKSRHAATSSVSHVSGSSSHLDQEEDEDDGDEDDDQDKENMFLGGNLYRDKVAIESSDDDFDQFLTVKATPKAKASVKKPCSAVKKNRPAVHVVSSDDDDCFEKFIKKVKTPKTKALSESGINDSIKNFIVHDLSSDDDFILPKSTTKVKTKFNTPTSQPPARKPPSQCHTPVFVSESDDDDAIVVKSTWKTRHSKPAFPTQPGRTKNSSLEKKETTSKPPPNLLPPKAPAVNSSLWRVQSEPITTLNDSASSDDEFSPLLERLKKKKNSTPSARTPKTSKAPPPKARATPASTVFTFETPHVKKLVQPLVTRSEPRQPPSHRPVCRTPGCFLQGLSAPDSYYERNFKQKKEELTAKLYQLYNTSVFDSKLPADMPVTWNKKMRKTAGYCISGQEREGEKKRYARIELSEKVCDSADRLRDTLIHEMCHAATWLINGIRDGHGTIWKLYARKSTVAHPELPVVTRCHSYDIKYKFQYQCVRCQNKIGRHSKSLDTQRFACALCTGQIVLLTNSKPREATPFAKFVKENYGTTRQEMTGQSHGDVMRQLSADFAAKTKLS